MVKKRSAGEGTISQLPSGSWRAQVSIDRKRLSATRRTKADAREWVREIQEQVAQGMTYEASQTRLDEFMRGWLETKRFSIRAATYEQYEIMIRVYIIPRLGDNKLIDLTPAVIKGFVDRMAREGVGARTVQVVYGVLQNALTHAQEVGLIGRNPVSVVRRPKVARNEMHVWSEDQVNRFLTGVQEDRNEALYFTALWTGMRQAELLGLKWTDIDWRNQQIKVVRQVVEVKGGGFTFQGPKSERGRRSIELGVGLVEKLRSQSDKVSIARQMARGTWHENDLVFPSKVGTPQLGTNVDREFHRLIKRTGVPRIRFHDMRHTAASIILSRGIPPVMVADMLGHTLSVLMSTYAHYIPGNRGEMARIMDEVTMINFLPGGKQVAHGLPTKME